MFSFKNSYKEVKLDRVARIDNRPPAIRIGAKTVVVEDKIY